MSSKRSRKVLSIEKKIEIINRLEKGEPGSSLAKVYDVGKTTISDIKSRKEVILQFASKLDSEDGSKKRKTMKKPKDEKLEDAMYLWFIQRRSKGEPITGPLLCEKALDMNEKLGGPSTFKASTGWLKNFKSRHGIRELEIQGESLSGNAVSAENFKKSFSAFVEKNGYSLDDIYNTDETGLNWKSLPSKSLASKREAKAPGFKVSKERITIVTTANASGTHALPLVMIGKSKQPRCFKNVTCLPVIYKAQKNAWMTGDIFTQWYRDDFIPKVKEFRKREKKTGKVLLIMDNAPSHPEAESLNSIDRNFSVMFLPPNVTALIQPMDQGVIEKLKMMYKKEVLRRLLLAENNEEGVIAFSKKLNLKDCSHMVADSWDKVTQSNLQNAWRKLLPKKPENDESADIQATNEHDHLQDIANILPSIPGFSDCDHADVNAWLESDNDPGYQIMDENDILNHVQESRDIIETDNENEDLEEVVTGPTHEQAFTALNTAMAWYEKQKESCPTQLILLKRIRDLAAEKRQSNLKQTRINDYFL